MADGHESDDKFGFIIIDEKGTLFGTLSGSTREVLHKFKADLPPKTYDRKRLSAMRAALLRMEKHDNYMRMMEELATQFYINPSNNQPNVSGLILAGSGRHFQMEIRRSYLLDPLLEEKIISVVDVSHGDEYGFNQAIELSAEIRSKHSTLKVCPQLE